MAFVCQELTTNFIYCKISDPLLLFVFGFQPVTGQSISSRAVFPLFRRPNDTPFLLFNTKLSQSFCLRFVNKYDHFIYLFFLYLNQ